jgi:hypothetical protein
MDWNNFSYVQVATSSFLCTLEGDFLLVATLVLDSRSRRRLARARAKKSVRKCEDENSHSQVSFHCERWSPDGLPNFQRAITEVKTSCIEELFMSLESYWSVDVLNGLSWPISTYVTRVMAKRKAGSQIDSLTPDHEKLGIDLTSVRAGGVWHTVEKISMRATTLL